MSEDWNGTSLEAASAIEENGFLVQVRRKAHGDPLPWVDAAPIRPTFSVNSIKLRDRRFKEDGIWKASIRLLSSCGEQRIAIGDEVQIEGKWHTVRSVEEVAPAGVGLYLKVELNK